MCGSFWEPLKGKITLMCGENNSKFPKIVTFEKKLRESRKEKGIHQFRKVEIHAGLLKKKDAYCQRTDTVFVNCSC